MNKAIFLGLVLLVGIGVAVIGFKGSLFPPAKVDESSQLSSGNNEKQLDSNGENMSGDTGQQDDFNRSEEEWKKILTPMQFKVTRKHGTERAFSGEYWDNKKDGIYNCVCCGLPLFSSETKYESGTGWPSFWQPLDEQAIGSQEDRSLFSVRTEVHCRRCKAHLGHVFPDGPEPTGLRYCLNSAALKFDEADTGRDQDGEK